MIRRCFQTLALVSVVTLSGVSWGKTILDLQKFKTTETLTNQYGWRIRLTNLNPAVNRWFLLEVNEPRGRSRLYHLENPDPKRQNLVLDENQDALALDQQGSDAVTCRLWGDGYQELKNGLGSSRPFAPLCQNRLYLRNAAKGHLSGRELAVEFVRDSVWAGESMISLLKKTVYKDSELIRAAVGMSSRVTEDASETTRAPLDGKIDPRFTKAMLEPTELGISGKWGEKGMMRAGHWYPSQGNDDVFVAAMLPEFVQSSILAGFTDRVLPLDAVEKSAMVYLVAFDLSNLEIGYAVGTNHPEVSYSERTADFLKVPGWPGPDGFGDYGPLVPTGSLNPAEARRVVATFNGGFKRKHSVFRMGEAAKRNGGSHYGFMQSGVIFSTLHDGLATAVLKDDGSFQLKSWTSDDNEALAHTVFARQNGRPLVYRDAKSKASIPGPDVYDNLRGNWSGSKDNSPRSLRTGICMQTVQGRNYLIFGLFSAHTPNAMARVFQSFDCDYAMHLDMNLVEHAYLATYFLDKNKNLRIEHVLNKMAEIDGSGDGSPRFVGRPDNRDFFYLLRKNSPHRIARE